MIRRIALLLPLFILARPLFAQRQVIPFNEHWFFAQGPAQRAMEPSFNHSRWQPVTLPHDWAIYGPFDPAGSGETGKLPWKGEGWYRKTFDWGQLRPDQKVFVLFDGVMAFPKVYINGRLAGEWDYGYNSFYLDITAFLRENAKNTIAVHADTRRHDSRWYPGAGIYRKVQLIVTDAVHIPVWGVWVTTPEVQDSRTRVRLQTQVKNEGDAQEIISVRQEIVSPAGTIVASDSAFCPVNPGETHRYEQWINLATPHRWSPESPELYSLRTTIYRNGRPCDALNTRFGVRTAMFTPDDGFWLNGSRYPLKGVCLHHDLGALGAAFNRRAMQRQLEIMKAMGCNAVRTSHNAPAPELLDLCDEMGLVVIDELFDKWDNKADFLPGGDFAAFAARNAANFIHRDRNHPSIVLWSIGNEIGDAQWNLNGGFDQLAVLSDLFRQMDPTRPITLVCDALQGATTRHTDYYDVISYNYQHRYDVARQLNPYKSVIITESASTLSSRGFYDPQLPLRATAFSDSLHVSSYDLNAPDWAEIPDDDFKWQEKDRFVAGEFVWTGFDYLGEPTPYGDGAAQPAGPRSREHLPRSSYFGIVDLAGIPKDRYYLYKSVWKPEETTVHLLPHWNWKVKKGQKIPVFVYTNGDCAELFLNGKSLGKRCKSPQSDTSAARYRLIWPDVAYEPGVLHTVAYKNGMTIGAATVTTAGAPAAIRLTADRDRLTAAGADDLSFILCEVVDHAGNVCPLAEDTLTVAVDGVGTFVAGDNGNPLSLESFQAPVVRVFHGKAMLIVRTNGQKGAINVQVTAQNLPLAALQLQAE